MKSREESARVALKIMGGQPGAVLSSKDGYLVCAAAMPHRKTRYTMEAGVRTGSADATAPWAESDGLTYSLADKDLLGLVDKVRDAYDKNDLRDEMTGVWLTFYPKMYVVATASDGQRIAQVPCHSCFQPFAGVECSVFVPHWAVLMFGKMKRFATGKPMHIVVSDEGAVYFRAVDFWLHVSLAPVFRYVQRYNVDAALRSACAGRDVHALNVVTLGALGALDAKHVKTMRRTIPYGEEIRRYGDVLVAENEMGYRYMLRLQEPK